MRHFEKQGEYLKKLRIEAGLTQRALGLKIGCHSQYVSNWERYMCAPTQDQMRAIRKHLPNFSKEKFIEKASEDAVISTRLHWKMILR